MPLFPRLAPALAVATLYTACNPVLAADAADPGLAQMREEIRQLKSQYEARLLELEQRLQALQAQGAAPAPASASSAAPPLASLPQAPATAAPAAAANPGQAANPAAAFNPEISLILGGSYARTSQDPADYRIQGFLPGGEEIGPGRRSFSLGESELMLRAAVDPYFSGQLNLALTPDHEAEVEEAFFETRGLGAGLNLKGGRFLSGIGYQNGQHAHTWDFVDLPLAYQAFFGGQYRSDGLQARWLAPTERYLEFGAEANAGNAFPGSQRSGNGIGATALFVHAGDDLGASASWRAGLSYLRASPAERAYEDSDASGTTVSNAFSGRSQTWILDGVLKWAPNGNATRTNFKLQGEYMWRRENGTLSYDTGAQSLGPASAPWSSAQSGWYLQGVYQFMPRWRAGLRFDKLYAGTPANGLLTGGLLSAADFPQQATYNPSRSSLMLDYSPSEFSRLRLQYARDRARPDAVDNQLTLQYIMSLGAHGAHSF